MLDKYFNNWCIQKLYTKYIIFENIYRTSYLNNFDVSSLKVGVGARLRVI